MRKIRSKLKRKSSNQKWKRGHSSTSNPTKTLHRDRARAKTLSNTGNNSGLTSAAVSKLNKLSGVEKSKKLNVPTTSETMNTEDTESMYSAAPTTVRSFMSSFSTNTNASFNKLLDCETLNERRKEMVAVLAASTETIKEQQGSETSAEYFMAFINSLALIEEVDRADPVIGLTNLVIKSVPRALLQEKFTFTHNVFIKLLEKFEEHGKQSGLIDTIFCSAVLLSAQDVGKWNGHGMLTLLQAVLSFTTHSKPKVRKAAVTSVTSLLRECALRLNDTLELKGVQNVVSKTVTSYCLDFFSATQLEANAVTVLHILGLIEHCFPYLHASDTKVTCEGLLSLSTSSNPLIRMHCYQALYTLLEAEECSLTDVVAGRLMSAIYDLQPDTSDVRQTIAWITVLKKGYIFMVKKNLKLCSEMLPRFMQLLVLELWTKEQAELITTVTASIKEVLQDVVSHLLENDSDKKYAVMILDYLTATLKNPFTVCYKQVIIVFGLGTLVFKDLKFLSVLHFISFFFSVYEIFGPTCSIQLKESLSTLASSYDPDGEHRREVENTILSAIKHVDIDVLLQAIPLTNTNGEISIERSWMLPLLREGLRKSSLMFFHTNIIPLASACLKKWKTLESGGKQNESHVYELLCCQLWGLFPGFCRQPTDCEKFSLIARTAGTILSDNLYLRAPILDGFKELIPSVIAERKVESVAKYAKNYLPILFNLYINKPKGSYENDLRVNILEIIKLFLKITPPDTLDEMFQTAFGRLKNTKEGDFSYNMIFDIIECFAIHLKSDQLNILYEEYVKPILNTSQTREEKNVPPKVKKAYRIICVVLSNDNENCKEFVVQKRQDLIHLLLKSEKLNGDNVMLTRLKCFKHLIQSADIDCDSELVRQCITETVLCFPNHPEKPHQLCTEMIKSIGTFFSKQNKLDEFIELILIGFTSDTTDILVKTIWSINSIIQLFSNNIDNETLNFILENVYSSVQSNNRMEAKSALCTLYTFIKHIPRPTLTNHLEVLVKTISKMVPDTKRFCRLPYGHLLKKLCHYYSAQEIIRLVPGNDLVTHKRLKKIRKELNRAKNQPSSDDKDHIDDNEMEIDQKLKTITINDVLKDSDTSDFDDSDSEDEEEQQLREKMKKDRKMEVCIREDGETIVDLTDVNAINKVSIKNKKNKRKPKENIDDDAKITFKTAPDGRLIIEEPKKYKKDFGALKAGTSAKRQREDSDSSQSDTDNDDNENKSSKSKFNGNKSKKLMGIHRSVSSNMSVVSGGKSVKSVKSTRSNKSAVSKKLKKEWNSGNKKTMQPYAYLPLNGSAKFKSRKRNKV